MRFVIAECDDWQVVYADGEKVMENHSIPLYKIMDYLADNHVTVEDVEFEFVSDEVLEDINYTFPQLLKDLPH